MFTRQAVYAESSVRGVRWAPAWPRRGGGGRWPWPRYGRGRMAAPRRGGGRADRGGPGAPGLGREREMPDAARAAALSRRAYEAATGRGLGGVGTVSPVKRLGAWGLCGCGAGPVCALWAVERRGTGGPWFRTAIRAALNRTGFGLLCRYPSIVLWADVPPEGRTTEVGGALRTLDGMRDLDLTPQRGRAGGILSAGFTALSPPPDVLHFPVPV